MGAGLPAGFQLLNSSLASQLPPVAMRATCHEYLTKELQCLIEHGMCVG